MISAIAFVMIVRDKPVTVERRLMPPQPKSNALSATYQRCCASLRVDSTFNQRFSSAESPRLGIQHSVENSRPFVQFILSQPLRSALIYHERDAAAENTAFILGLVAGTVLFGLTWMGAPAAALVFGDPRAVAVTRVLGLAFPLSALGIVQNAHLAKELAFKTRLKPQLAKVSAKGLVSVVLALYGYGAWSLILGQLAGIAVQSVVFWIIVRWKPSWAFEWRRAHALLRYGLNIVGLNALAALVPNP